MRSTLCIALWATGCSTFTLFKLDEEPPPLSGDSSPVTDSGMEEWEHVSTAGPGVPPVDTAIEIPDPCPIQAAEAGLATGSPTCTALGEVTWELALELDYANLVPTGGAVSIPLADGAKPTLYLLSAPTCLLGLDMETGFAHNVVCGMVHDIDAVAAVRARDGHGFVFVGINAWEQARVVDLETGGYCSQETAVNFSPTTLDLDRDGCADAAVGDTVIGADCSVQAEYPSYGYNIAPCIADIDGEGTPEVFSTAGGFDFTSGAAWEWDALIWQEGGHGYFLAGVLALGSQPVIAGFDSFRIFLAHTTGEVIWKLPPWGISELASTNVPFAAGDVDGDGEAEIAAAYVEDYVGEIWLWSLAGEVLWQQPRGGYAGGITMADLNADGRYEVIDWSSAGLFIYDGATGTILASDTSLRTWYWINPPIVADVDGDGSAEIVVTGEPMGADASDMTQDHLYIFGAASGRWARTRPVWHQMAYDVTSIRDDGTLVSFPFPSWQTYNTFRAQPAHDGLHPDLTITATDMCADSCEQGPIRLAAQVSNLGSVDASAGALVKLLAWHEDEGVLREVARTTIDEPIVSGWSAEGVLFEVPLEDWGQRQVLEVTGTHLDECDRVNDRFELWQDPCLERSACPGTAVVE